MPLYLAGVRNRVYAFDDPAEDIDDIFAEMDRTGRFVRRAWFDLDHRSG